MSALSRIAPALTLVALMAAPEVRAVDAVGVLPVADPPGPDETLAALAGALRTALAARIPGVLSGSELRQLMRGGAQPERLEALDADYQTALALHAGGDFEWSIRRLRALLARVEQLPGGEEVHGRWVRIMLRLARSEQAVGRRAEAQVLLERLLRIEPEAAVDPRLYPPGFQKLVEDVRAEVKALWTRKLTVRSQPGAVVFLERRPVGEAPVALDLPPGRYHVSAALGDVRAREVEIDLATDDRDLAIDLSVAEVLRPDAGPGLVIAGPDRTGRIVTVGGWLGLDRVVAVRAGAEGGRSFLAAATHDVHRGTTEREGRVWLEDGTLTPAVAAALAAHLLSGEASPLVEVGPSLDPALQLIGPGPGVPLGPPPSRRARALGWTAAGAGATGVVLAAISVAQLSRANQAYGDARGMLDGDRNVRDPFTVAQYNDAIRKGDRARGVAIGTGVGAGVSLAASAIMGYLAYRQGRADATVRF